MRWIQDSRNGDTGVLGKSKGRELVGKILGGGIMGLKSREVN